ncbi:MAG: lipoyl synthase [Desulfatiglandales bacterium]
MRKLNPKPPWIRVRLPSGETYAGVKALKRSKSLHTVCEEAVCPNIGECWEKGNATFMILGDVCTRNCSFCAVKGGRPGKADFGEPLRVAEAAAKMGLRHLVVTSVTRDDLKDGGASVFAETIRQLHEQLASCTVEVLIPDFKGERQALEEIVHARPEILGHNVETVLRLYPRVRPQALYQRSLEVLGMVKDLDPNLVTKSGIMVGLGETRDELLEVMHHLRDVGCDILTMGQYLRPSMTHLPVIRYYTPEEFEALKKEGYAAGFRWVESGPLVRSSYGAESQVRALLSN